MFFVCEQAAFDYLACFDRLDAAIQWGGKNCDVDYQDGTYSVYFEVHKWESGGTEYKMTEHRVPSTERAYNLQHGID